MADDATLPSEDEIRQLPLWARVAFAARCARRALPQFQKHWQDAPKEYIEGVLEAVKIAELSATVAEDDLADVVASAVTYANAAANAVVYAGARAAAYAAAYAVRTATHACNYDYGDTIRASRASADATSRATVPVSLIRSDFQRALEESRRQKWTDDSPVPSTIFPPIEDMTNGPKKTEIPQQFRLKLRAIAERGLAADTVRKHLVAVYKALNEHFLETYGTFLTRDQFNRLVFEETRVRV